MKRTNCFSLCRAFFAAALAAALVFMASCASVAGPKVDVNAFDTLDSDALVYLSVPVAVHSELTNSMLKAMIGNDVSDKYIKSVTDSIDRVYIGIGSPNDRGRLQVACDGTVSTASKLALASSNYFEKKVQNVNAAGLYPVFVEKRSRMQISNPGSDIVLISPDVLPLLKKYDEQANAQAALDAEWKDSEPYKFVGDPATKNVRLYMNKPLSFITNLLGTSLSSAIFQLNYIEGDFEKLPSGKYSVDLSMEFSRDNLISKAAAFLKVALLMTDSKVTTLDERHLTVTGIQVSLSQMQKMLGIN